MAAPRFDVDRAARDWVAAFRRLRNSQRTGDEFDVMERIAAAVDHGGNESHRAFDRAVLCVAADALDALEARDGAAGG